MIIKIIATGSSKWERLIKKWGVSFLINDDILFDTFGKPSVLNRQLKKLSIDVSKIKHIIISHDDWDHISGLWDILEINKNVTVYICPNFSQEIKQKINSCGVKIVEVSDFQKISEGVYSTGEMRGNSEGKIIYEQSLILESPNGLAIITGCAHPGIINIIEKVRSRFRDSICLLIGGMHLKDKGKKETEETVLKFKEYNIAKVAPMHCTGRYATRLMEKVFKDNFIRIKQGSIVNI
jgi:7,8-dihydropterin-6-yl-methyl-4-(beta-D-ribofuranosyl)aminobenzene 5'-phosphate synthase